MLESRRKFTKIAPPTQFLIKEAIGVPTLNTGYFGHDQGGVIHVVVLDGFIREILHDLGDRLLLGEHFTNGVFPKSIHDSVGANHNALGVLQG